jgi:hypothetical protein
MLTYGRRKIVGKAMIAVLIFSRWQILNYYLKNLGSGQLSELRITI